MLGIAHYCTMPCRLLAHCGKPCFCRPEDVHGDNCCRCTMAVLKSTTGINQSQVLYADLRSSFLEIPFYIAADRDKRTVVLSIRGTLAMADWVSDAMAMEEVNAN